MRIHYLQHVSFEGLGSIEQWALARDAQITCSRLYEGVDLPSLSDVDLLVIMGGPMGIYEYEEFPWLKTEKEFLKEAVASDTKILGICLGAQLLADVLGAKVYPNAHKELGWLPIETVPEASQTEIGEALADCGEVFHWHGDTFDLPEGAVHLARSVACENQAFLVDERILGLQFHLETTPDSARLLIENCRDEIVDAPFIQAEKEMLSDLAKFSRINALMAAVLDRL